MNQLIDPEGQQILAIMREKNYYRDTAAELLEALKKCETALFAVGEDYRADSAWATAHDLINKLEKGKP